ncbi:glycosyltransferase family 4 protein [Trichocoleus sp. FACHB-591]|uniref:glycosyltransferase family 4 protein n=1 Tax=Trichocoleus sp. FACHB-591 TaxID=2692872 RepID=UPI0016858060|nr:glycosyltransferase family 4 protein [Trichocoleus sp. FACHB-591]MBD2096309.1 glycosyltransferase family 4 protein [Trichocoleus sp. FACHB-591]
MNILHINQSDIVGGAAIAGYRLHQGLLAQGAHSRLLVDVAKTSGAEVATISRRRYAESVTSRFAWRLGLNYINITNSFGIPEHSFYQEADIINFHNLHGDYFNYLALPKLTKHKFAVLTLHDMWSFTGRCVYSYNCDRWKIGCGQCPDLSIMPEVKTDSSRLEWWLKNWIYGVSNLVIVSPSKWLAEQISSSMLARFPIHYIPHGIDIETYQPLDPIQCRTVLGIPLDKKVLMLGAQNLQDPRKGTKLLLESLQNLPAQVKATTVLLTLGDGGETISSLVDIPTFNLGYISGDRIKAVAYSAADIFVFPSQADIFGLVLQESMACGTPLVSFKVGGIPDLVRPGQTGYLAEPNNVEDFCNGIIQLLEDKALRDYMSQKCRAIALQEYSLELQAKRYIELYEKILDN